MRSEEKPIGPSFALQYFLHFKATLCDGYLRTQWPVVTLISFLRQETTKPCVHRAVILQGLATVTIPVMFYTDLPPSAAGAEPACGDAAPGAASAQWRLFNPVHCHPFAAGAVSACSL